MVKGGKVSSKGGLRKRVRSKGGGSDDSDEDYVVSDDAGNVSDCAEDDCFSLDGCAAESFDGFIEDEDVEEEGFRRVTKFKGSRGKTGVRRQGKNVSKTARKRRRIEYAEELDEEEEEEEDEEEEVEEEDDDDYDGEEEEDEEEEKEVEEVEYEEEEEEEKEVEEVEYEEEEEEKEVEEVDGNDEDEDFNYDDDEFIPEEEDYTDEEEEERRGGKKKKKDFSYEDEEFIPTEEERSGRKKKKEDFNDEDEELIPLEEERRGRKKQKEDLNYEDEEFIPTEEDYTDEEEEETRGITKKNNGIKMGKKRTLKKRVSATSSRGRKRSGSRVSKKPKRKRRGKSGGSRRKVKCDDDADDFFDNGPAIRTNSRKKSGQKRRRVLVEDANSGSDCETRLSDYEFTISEEEKEQVREAMELCGNIRRNLRRASLRMKNEEVEIHEDLHQQRKPPAQKGKEKIEESQGRKGKEKVEELKIEVTKQVCGICLSEENKRRVRGILNSCTHYFCFACIMEWSKVESRCPLCKQRFKTISKPTRSTTAQEAVIQVPERDQVYQPTEEELRSYIDPYESVICSECNLGGDDGLMLLCDICDSPAHTYCVGLGREVPEGNWYCDGCRPVALASLNSQAQERSADIRVTTQSQPSRPSPVHIRETIDLNLMSSPYTSFGQGFGHLSSSRFSGRSAEGASPMSGGGAPTVSERRRIHRQIQQLRSMDRMTYTTGRVNGVSATSTISNLHSSEIDQNREPTSPYTRTQDVGTSYHTFFEERLGNNISPLMQNGDHFSTTISNSIRSVVQDSTMFSNVAMNAVIWPGFSGTRTLSDIEPIHPFSSRSNIVTECSIPPTIIEEDNLHIVKEQVQSMVKSQLKRLSEDADLDYSTFKDIAKSSTHTILAACGLEHKTSEVCMAPPPSVCPHIELIAGGQTSMMKGCCSSCFDSFVGDVVKRILDTRMSSQWLRLGI
ncbi:uncharacterized protein LOC131610541 isoform X2 [Vicia villosa]|uniref:uncharacterized protein LOC131610541 isoform X2 n=1 Tax=Vicia villosa TaxID=3911 RepID=UPI00273B9586|nr:uncharacterized protein LOC131610541 isoform X2 [Vicia villosa]